MNGVQWVWLALLLLFLLAEAGTTALVSIWFAAGALLALVSAVFWPGAVWLQIVVFIAASVLALLAARPLAKKLLKNKPLPTNADAAIGKICEVTKEVRPEEFGRARLEGLEWTAKSDVYLPVGAFARVEAIEGVKLVLSLAQQAE
ncbi:MAG: NfeD family protein [Oscillospiraceae bacterium]